MIKLAQPNISDEAIAAVVNVLKSGMLVHGVEGDAFELELAAYLGCKEVVLVSSGTAALHLALLSLNIGKGDAVVVPNFTFPATANSVLLTGARAILVDVRKDSYTMNTELLERTIHEWDGPEVIRAVMPVHEFGYVANMNEILATSKRYGLAVIEDAACALGAKYDGEMAGTIGDLGCFSFHPRKTLTTGEGGAIATNRPELASRLRRLRNHGMERSSNGARFLEASTNYRLTDFQAALGRRQLPNLNEWISKRTELARVYISELEPLAYSKLLNLPNPAEGHSWQTFMVALAPRICRDQVIHGLRILGIEANVGAQCLSEIGIYGDSQLFSNVSLDLHKCGLALPLHERMSTGEIRKVSAALASVLADFPYE